MTNKSIPRIGRQNAREALEQLLKIVNFEQPIPEEELREQMEQYNEDRGDDLFQDIDEFLSFVWNHKSSSVQIIEETPEGVVLSEEGNTTLQADNLEKALFELLVEKSETEFTYFAEVIHELDRMYEDGNYTIGTNRVDSINNLMRSGSNTVTAGTIAGLLLDFDLIRKEEDGFYRLNPEQYAYLRGGKEEIFLDLLESASNERMDREELEEVLISELGWASEAIESVLAGLRSQGLVQTDRYEGKQVIERVRY